MILVGAIQGAFGVQGELRLKSFTAHPADIFEYSPFLNEKGEILFDIKSWREIKDGFAFYPKKALTREQAMLLRSTKLYVSRDKFPQLEEDEFYHVDLIGIRLEDLSGNYLGKVKAIITTGDDLLEVFDTPDIKKSWFIPFTKENVPIVDIKNGKMVCDLPDGLIPDDSDAENPDDKDKPK